MSEQHHLPIAPLPPVLAAGQKRKLVPSHSATLFTAVADHHHSRGGIIVNPSGGARIIAHIPRRDTAPVISTIPVVAASVVPALATAVSPSDYWKGLMNEWNVPILDTVGIEQDDSEDRVDFLETTPDRIAAYQSFELLTAVRRRDLATLKRIAAETAAKNSTMNACNRFGESILHLACRKGSVDVVELLVGVAPSPPLPGCDCSLMLRDDYGRTVLHDACWTINPPWELIKLILKKAPVLWRVSDVRGHLALQYVPKSAWPQWTAFLTKNKELLKRVMIHSYHRVDIAQQQQQQHVTPVAVAVASQSDATANDSSSVPLSAATGSLPQHQSLSQSQPPASQQPQRHLVPPATSSTASATPRSNANGPLAPTATSTQVPASIVLSLATANTLAKQANAVLARALAQANPAMIQALSRGVQPKQEKQGVQTIPPPASTGSRPLPTQAQHAPIKMEAVVEPPPVVASAPAPGPATAALDEALKAQAEDRAQKRSEQQGAAPKRQLTHKQHQQSFEKDHESSSQQHQPPQPTPSGSKQAPLPYAPSISMIAKRLAGYKKEATAIQDEQALQQQKQQHQSQSHQTSEEPQAAQGAAESSSRAVLLNPLPAVPNPLLTTSENEMVQQDEQEQQTVPSSLTTTQSSAATIAVPDHIHDTAAPAVPNPIILTGEEASLVPTAAPIESSSEEATAGIIESKAGIIPCCTSSNSTHSTSSLTMSLASPSETDHLETSSTTTSTTSTDSVNAVTTVTAPTDSSTGKNEPRDGIQTEHYNDTANEVNVDGESSISDVDCDAYYYKKSDVSDTTKQIAG